MHQELAWTEVTVGWCVQFRIVVMLEDCLIDDCVFVDLLPRLDQKNLYHTQGLPGHSFYTNENVNKKL